MCKLVYPLLPFGWKIFVYLSIASSLLSLHIVFINIWYSCWDRRKPRIYSQSFSVMR
ncbi:hypothetical protein CR513_24027, partial [Mucuna pruriens]